MGKSKICGENNYKADEHTAPLVSMFVWTQNTFTETKPQPSFEDNTDKNIFIPTMLPQEWNLQSSDSKTMNGNAMALSTSMSEQSPQNRVLVSCIQYTQHNFKLRHTGQTENHDIVSRICLLLRCIYWNLQHTHVASGLHSFYNLKEMNSIQHR